jgi:hypothetical protein
VALELADHGGHGIGDERVGPLRLVAVDRLDQPEPGHLAQVLEGHGPVAPVAFGQPVGQAEVGQDDAFAQDRVTALGVVTEPLLDALDGVLVLGADLERFGRGSGTRGIERVDAKVDDRGRHGDLHEVWSARGDRAGPVNACQP